MQTSAEYLVFTTSHTQMQLFRDRLVLIYGQSSIAYFPIGLATVYTSKLIPITIGGARSSQVTPRHLADLTPHAVHNRLSIWVFHSVYFVLAQPQIHSNLAQFAAYRLVYVCLQCKRCLCSGKIPVINILLIIYRKWPILTVHYGAMARPVHWHPRDRY